MMMKSVFWWRNPEYPEETTDLRQFTFYFLVSHMFHRAGYSCGKWPRFHCGGIPVGSGPGFNVGVFLWVVAQVSMWGYSCG